jgi:hypothetical protein
MSNPNFRTCPTTFLLSDQPLLVASIDGTLPLRSHARTLFRQAPTRAVNIVAPGILYISKTYIELMVGDINDQFRQQQALEHMLKAQELGTTLKEYASRFGLDVQR